MKTRVKTRVKTLAPPRESPDQAASWSHPLPTPQVDTTLLYTGEILPHATVRVPCGSRSLARSSKDPGLSSGASGPSFPCGDRSITTTVKKDGGPFNGLRNGGTADRGGSCLVAGTARQAEGEANKVAGSAKRAVRRATKKSESSSEGIRTEGQGTVQDVAGKVERKVRGAGKSELMSG
jgi:hypothetical protein